MAKGCLQANQEPGVDGSAPDQLLGQIQQLLKQKGVSLEDGATREAVLKAVISILEGGSDKPPEDEESAQVAANVRKELGLPEKATKEEVLVALATLKRKPEAEAELAAMRSELAAIKEREAERSARELVEADIEANKINPHDEKHVERCIAFAKADPQRYQEFMQGVAPIVATGRTEAPAGGSPAAGEQAEDKLIAESLDAHKGNAKQAYISLQKRLLAELEEGAGYSRAKAANVLRQRYPKIFA